MAGRDDADADDANAEPRQIRRPRWTPAITFADDTPVPSVGESFDLTDEPS